MASDGCFSRLIFTADAQIYSRSMSFIENLPDEILLEVFAFLTSGDLKSVMQSSHIFANVVSSSSVLMRKFFIVITTKRKWNYQAISTLRRKFQNLVIFDFVVEKSLDDVLMMGLKNIGENLKLIEFNNSSMCAEDFVQILKCCENLNQLKVLNSKIYGTTLEFLDLKNLRNLIVIKSEISCEIFKNVQSLNRIQIEVNESQNVDLTNFQKILSKQSKLKHLTLINLRLSNLFDIKMNYLFQLESLKIYCHFKHKENFEIFLENQNSLNEIELTFSNMKIGNDRVRYYDSVIECMLRKEKLRKFTLKIDEYKFSNFNFLIASQIKFLSVHLKDTNFLSSQFMNFFPHLIELELDTKEELNNENIELLNKSSVCHLKIHNLPSECFAKIKIKSLKSLQIHEVSINECDWMTFVENNSQITKLVINFSFLMDFGVNLVSKLTKTLDLEHIELVDKYLGFENEIYEMIVENCKNTLKYLKLWNINVEKDFTEKDKEYLRKRHIKFHLFNDTSLNKQIMTF